MINLFSKNLDSSMTIGELYQFLLKDKFDISMLLEYIDTYDIEKEANKNEFLSMYYMLITDSQNLLLANIIRSNYSIKELIATHFLSRLLMRYKNHNASSIFNIIRIMSIKAHNMYGLNRSEEVVRVEDHSHVLIFNGRTNTLVSIFSKNNTF